MEQIMDRIAAAESEAEAIRREAEANSRERIAQAKQDAETSLSLAGDAERAATKEALAKAAEEGESLAAKVAKEQAEQTTRQLAAADAHTAEAVAYLMERVEAQL